MYYAVVVGVGAGSFVLNRRNFSLGRFLIYAAAAAAWGVMFRFSGEFALIFAATLTLNGQEWYQDRFGASGRLGTGWATWSIGGRAVTIVVVFLCVAKGLTGWGRTVAEPQFGFGFNPDDFAFEAADFLKTAPIRGNILNTTAAQGDALAWRAYPGRKSFLDDRKHLFPRDLQAELGEIRRALRDDKVDVWKPALDRYGISAVMIQQPTAPRTYDLMMQSPNWVPFYDDGNVVLFGRADAPEVDLAYFRSNRLDATSLAYRHARPAPSGGAPPTPTSWLDTIFRGKSLTRPQSHDDSSRRWLEGAGIGLEPGAPALPDPARCLLAIREARVALSRNPNDYLAYRLLADAYRLLMVEEAALLGGLEPTPANAERIGQLTPRPDLLMNRFRQRASALNYAIQTTPPPTDPAARRDLQRLNLDLSRLYLSVNYFDLARDRLQAVLSASRPGDLQPDFRAQLQQDLGRFNEQVRVVQERMDELTAEQQAGPLQRAGFALGQGAVGLAIGELEEALQINIAPALVKPQLIDLYCDTGQPEKALDLIGGNIDDPTLGADPGTAALRQGRVWLLLGNYEYAATLWERNAIPQIRYARTLRALSAVEAMLLGTVEPAPGIPPQAAQAGPVPLAATSLMSIPGANGAQATWQYDLALCRLESGQPALAADQFTGALTLAPNLNTRPIAAYYLKQLDKPIPPARTPDQDAAPKAKEDEPAAKPGADAPKDDKPADK